MKHAIFFLLAALVFITVPAFAGVPHMINYQGYLTDTAGEPLDTTVAMTFAFYDAATGGVTLWTESHASITVQEGLFDTLLGSVNAIPDSVFKEPLQEMCLNRAGSEKGRLSSSDS